MHAIAAALTGQPILQLQDSEAKELGAAIHGICEHYQIALTGQNAVWVRLIVASGMIYGPRAMSLAQSGRKARVSSAAAPATPPPGGVPAGAIDWGNVAPNMQ